MNGRQDAIVTVHDLVVSHGGRELLRCPHFEVSPRQRIAVVGPSGSGKTLFCQALLGLLDRSAPPLKVSGQVRWAGTSVNRRPRVGFVPQGTSSHLHPAYRVGEQIKQLIQAATSESGQPRDPLPILEELRLTDAPMILRQYPHELSGGMRQRVLIALALSVRPDLLVLDEPTAALDSLSRIAALTRILREVEARDIGLVYVTHRNEEALLLAERVLRVSSGNIEVLKENTANPEHASTGVNTPMVEEEPVRQSYHRSGAQEGVLSRRQMVLDVAGLCVDTPSRRHREPILVDCTLQVRAGQKFGVVGESGSGKTTLLKCLAGLFRPSAGRVRILGSEPDSLSRRQYRSLRRYFQLVSQDPRESLNPIMTVEQLLVEPSRIHGHAAPSRSSMDATLVHLGLKSSVKHQVAEELSFGQRQRIALARAILGFPDLKLLMLDEPASGLDVDSTRHVIDMFQKAGDRTALLVASHDLRFLEEFCDSVIVLRDGCIVEQASLIPWTFESDYARLYSDASRAERAEDLRRLEERMESCL